jgi:hypothetical protein
MNNALKPDDWWHRAFLLGQVDEISDYADWDSVP